MKERNEEKAKILYDFLDQSKLFKGTVRKEDRSLMNVPFVTGDEGSGCQVRKRGNGSRLCKPERPPHRWRYARIHLQCNAKRGRRGAGCVHEEV